MTFPDQKTAEAMANSILESTSYFITKETATKYAIAAYMGMMRQLNAEVTGIDVADVIAKLSAGTHVLMPEKVLEQYGYAKGDYMGICIDCREQMSGVAKRAHVCKQCAMIRAAQEKVE